MTSTSQKRIKSGGAYCINNNSAVIDNPAAKTANMNNPSSVPPLTLPKPGTGYYNNVGISSAAAYLLGTSIYDGNGINLNSASTDGVDTYGIFNQND